MAKAKKEGRPKKVRKNLVKWEKIMTKNHELITHYNNLLKNNKEK
jgi:hypothetical protein